MTPLLAAIACAAAAILSSQPTDPPKPPPVEELAKRYPKNRDYANERHELIMSRQPKGVFKSDGRTDDRWLPMILACPQLVAINEYAIDQSPVLLPWAEKLSGDGVRLTPWECACDALKGRYDLAPAAGELHDIMARYRASAVAGLVKSLDRPGPVIVPTDRIRPLLMTLTPWMGSFRGAARFHELRALVALHEGDAESFIGAITSILAISDISEREPTIMGRLIALAIRAKALDDVTYALVSGKLTPAMRTEIKATLDAPREDSWSYTIAGERILALDMIDLAFTDSRRLAELSGNDDFSSRFGRALAKMKMAPREECLWHLDGIYTLLDRTGGTDPDAAEAASRQLAAITERLGSGGPDHERYLYSAILAPSAEKVVRAEHSLRNHWNAVRTLLAIEVYREDHGRPPETLAALVPNYLDKTPKDWMTFGKGELKYTLIDATTDALHRPYLLYSVGADRQDDHGREAANRFRALSGNDDDKGLDFVFNWTETWPKPEPPGP